MNQFLFIFNTVAPVFLITILGIFLKRWKLISDTLVKEASALVFTVALPALIFIKLSATDFTRTFNPLQLGYILGVTAAGFVLLWLISALFIKNGRDLGAFVQGAYRSNYAIVGFAIVLNLWGDDALTQAAVILAFAMPLYNLLAVIILTVPMHREQGTPWRQSLLKILTNPLIIATVLSLFFSCLKIELPYLIIKTGNYLASMALPVALIAIGGSLNLEAVKKASSLALTASTLRLIVLPALYTAGAIALGFRGEDLGVMFILFATPTAVSSFVMAKTLQANARLAGNIVLISTLASALTITLGLTLLMKWGYL